jgi:hypothetical protein
MTNHKTTRAFGVAGHNDRIGSDVEPTRHSQLLDAYQSIKLDDITTGELTDAVIMTCYLRATRLFEKLDEGFMGEPFLDKFSVDSPENQRRYRAYVVDFTQAMDLFERTVRLRELIFSTTTRTPEAPLTENNGINEPKEGNGSKTDTNSRRSDASAQEGKRREIA